MNPFAWTSSFLWDCGRTCADPKGQGGLTLGLLGPMCTWVAMGLGFRVIVRIRPRGATEIPKPTSLSYPKCFSCNTFPPEEQVDLAIVILQLELKQYRENRLFRQKMHSGTYHRGTAKAMNEASLACPSVQCCKFDRICSHFESRQAEQGVNRGDSGLHRLTSFA